MESGIYAFYNDDNGFIYVGKSKNIASRMHSHLSSLAVGKHFNNELQKFYDAYDGKLKFVILDKCPIKDLPKMEQYYIDFFMPVCNKVKRVDMTASNRNPDQDNMETCQACGEQYELQPGTSTLFCQKCNTKQMKGREENWYLWVYGGKKNPLVSGRSKK